MTSAKTSYDSIHGLISTDWKVEKGKFKLDVTIPPNTTAQVIFPNGITKEIGSGTYHF
jgi:alpha-L-rhamnosidase